MSAKRSLRERLFGSSRQRRTSAVRKPPALPRHLETLEERVTPAPVHDVTTSMDYSTIQAAVNAANPNDVILADAGTYNELVVINKPLTIQGAQHGVDARTRGVVPESVV